MNENYKIETKCVQSGWQPKNGEPRVLPIYQSTTYKYETSEQMGKLFDLEESGYFYTRLQNPTNDYVAQKICDLEGGVAAMLTLTGKVGFTVMVMSFDAAGLPVAQVAFDVRTQDTTSPSLRAELVKDGLLEPTLVALTYQA